MIEAVQRRKVRDVVADRLKAFIADQGFKPGDRLPTETALAALFGVSRVTLREATKALEFFGLLESKPGVGLTVGSVNFLKITEYLRFNPTLQDATPVQLVDARLVIEVGVLPHVIRRMREDPAVYESLNRINDDLRHTADLERWFERDIAFHRRLVECSGVSPLLAFNDLLMVFFQRFQEGLKKGDLKGGVARHQRILDLLRDGQLSAACDELTPHIQGHLERLGGPATDPACSEPRLGRLVN